jgi:hypothetical protein
MVNFFKRALGAIGEILPGAILVVMPLGITAGIVLLSVLVVHPAERYPARLEPAHSMATEFERQNFTPTELAARIPQIKLVSCIFSEKALMHHLGQVNVALQSCGERGPHVTISDSLIDIVVSGIATIEKVDHPFTVTLEHNPISITEDGLIVTAISVEP